MILGEYIRRFGFDIIDFLQGRPVMKNYKEIEDLFTHPDKVEDHQNRCFQKLAEWATSQTEFYKGVKKRGGYKLSDFPIINKNIIKSNSTELMSPMAQKRNCIKMHTSGSTGTPLVIIQDKKKRNRVYAEMMYMWGLSGYKIGMRYVFLRRWNSINRKSVFTAYARNLIMEDVTSLDRVSLEKIANRIKRDKQIKMIIGYASTLDYLAEYMLEQGFQPKDFRVKTILSGSEVLSEKTRIALKEVFGCNVISLYSNQENGMLAVECNENKEFHLNTASYIIELLKMDSDEPAAYGELGRIVITDLYNYAMPLLRYDTGDVAICKREAECSLKTQTLESIAGRKVDFIYNTDGIPMSPHTITNGLWYFSKLHQFQLIQKGKREYKFIVNDPKVVYKDNEFIKTCKSILGENAQIEIERVDDIPVLASGKFKYLVCEWDGENEK